MIFQSWIHALTCIQKTIIVSPLVSPFNLQPRRKSCHRIKSSAVTWLVVTLKPAYFQVFFVECRTRLPPTPQHVKRSGWITKILRSGTATKELTRASSSFSEMRIWDYSCDLRLVSTRAIGPRSVDSAWCWWGRVHTFPYVHRVLHRLILWTTWSCDSKPRQFTRIKCFDLRQCNITVKATFSMIIIYSIWSRSVANALRGCIICAYDTRHTTWFYLWCVSSFISDFHASIHVSPTIMR